MNDFLTQAQMQTGLKYIHYAYDAYTPCRSPQELRDGLWSITGDEGHCYENINDWLIDKQYSPILAMPASPESVSDPINKFYGVCAYINNEIIVAFRGTIFFGGRENYPWWNPLEANSDEFMQFFAASYNVIVSPENLTPACQVKTYAGVQCRVNTVFANILERVRDSYQWFIDDRSQHATPNKIVFCGHSLGGALAQLAAAEYAGPAPPLPVYVVTYGAPKVGDDNFASLFQSYLSNTSYFFANQYDPVPTLYQQGLSPEWDWWTQWGQFNNQPPPSATKFINFAAQHNQITLANPSCANLFLIKAAYCHPVQYYYEGIQSGNVTDPTWSWSGATAISSNSNYINPSGDYAAVSYFNESGDYVMLAYPVESNDNYYLTTAVYNGESWIFNSATSVTIKRTQGVQLVVYQGEIHACWVDSDNNIMLGKLSLSGTYTAQINVTALNNEKSDRAPAVLTANGRLYFIYRAGTGSTLRTFSLHYEMNDAGVVETKLSAAGTLQSGAASQDAPAACEVLGFGGLMVYRGWSTASDHLYYSTINYEADGVNERDWKQYETAYSTKQPAGVAILYTLDKIYAVSAYKTGTTGSSGMKFWYLDISSNATSVPTENSISNLSSGTNNAVPVINYRNKIYLFFCDNNNKNRLSYSTLS